MKTAPRTKSEAKLPWEAGVATIIYKPRKMDIFEHADFCRRWFNNIVDMSQMPALHGNVLVSTQGEHFEFRTATFLNFREVRGEKPLTVVKCQENGDTWILRPDWITSLRIYTNGSTGKQTPPPINSYRDVLRFIQMFVSDGETMRRLISAGRIKEIL